MQGRIDPSVREQMQRDWNERAREDANFYVAFGRRDQDPEEFFESAHEIVRSLETEMRRLGPGNPRARRALEIGCGPGRLMRPLSRHFGEIHGIDVSDEMIRRAAANLSAIPHAHVHHTSGADLAPFADESFDFVYSYAVFQHIPSREVVMQYLDEACRVLKPGGVLRAQINGLDQTAKQYDTWSGVRISSAEVRDFARERGLQLLALEGARTQYMWTTLRKRLPDADDSVSTARVRRLTNTFNSEPIAPPVGRFSSVTAWVERFPAACGLNDMEVAVGGMPATPCYIGPPEADGLQQVNIMLPRLERTGIVEVAATWRGQLLFGPHKLRIIPPPPPVPVVVSASDGIDLLSGSTIVTGVVKVTLEEAVHPEMFRATLDGVPVTGVDVFCADPLPPRHEINFHLPEETAPGERLLEMFLGNRLIGRSVLNVRSR